MGLVGIASWLWLIVLVAIYVVDIVAIPLMSAGSSDRNVIKRIKTHWPWLLVGVILAIVLDLCL